MKTTAQWILNQLSAEQVADYAEYLLQDALSDAQGMHAFISEEKKLSSQLESGDTEIFQKHHREFWANLAILALSALLMGLSIVGMAVVIFLYSVSESVSGTVTFTLVMLGVLGASLSFVFMYGVWEEAKKLAARYDRTILYMCDELVESHENARRRLIAMKEVQNALHRKHDDPAEDLDI